VERLAKDVMKTRVITVTPETPLPELARIFSEDEISGAPVVTVDGRLVGIVSKTDLLNRVVQDPSAPGMGPVLTELSEATDLSDGFRSTMPEMESESDRDQLGTVDDIMEPEVVTVPTSAPLSAVAAKMGTGRIHRVIVVDAGKVRGIITSLDLISNWPKPSVLSEGPARRSAAPAKTAKPARAAARKPAPAKRSAKRAMTRAKR
jgi:CBS domain-containing protein